jgi:hypothetical protein
MSNYQTNKKIRINKKNGDTAKALIQRATFDEQYSKSLKYVFEDFNVAKAGQLKDFYTLTAYSSIYARVSDKLKEVIETVDGIRYFYLVEVMLNQITEDALAPKIGDDDIFKFSCQKEDIQKELDDLKKRLGLDQLIENIAPDLLAYGEYTLKTKIGTSKKPVKNDLKGGDSKFIPKAGKGIIDVKDIVDQGTVVSLTQDGVTEGYIVYDEERGRVEIKEVADYIKFSMGGTRIKIETSKILPVGTARNPQVKEIIDNIPRFIRMGKSVLYPVIPKIKELEILEKLIPATKINKLSQGNLVGMNLPENYNLEEAEEAVRRIESMVNKKISVDPVANEITVESILSTAGKTKVIPLFGDKGRLDQMDFRDNEPDDLLGSAKEIRELILDSVGIPSELVFKSDGDTKAEVLKRYAKYLRKLKKLQKTISQGIKQIAFIHLANKDIPFKEEEIEVVFNNNLVEIDNLDKLEHADVTLSLLGNVRDFFNDMVEEESPYKDNINLDKVTEYLEENLSTIGMADAILTKKEGGAKADPDAVQNDDVDSKGNPTTKETPEETVERLTRELNKAKKLVENKK